MYSQIYLSIYLCSCLVPIYVLENLLSDTITQFNNVQLATIFPQSRTTSNPILTLANEIASPRLPAAAFRSIRENCFPVAAKQSDLKTRSNRNRKRVRMFQDESTGTRLAGFDSRLPRWRRRFGSVSPLDSLPVILFRSWARARTSFHQKQ